MKRILLVILFVLFLSPAMVFSQVAPKIMHNLQTATVGWDKVTPGVCACPTPPCTPTAACPVNGQPAVGAIKYKVYSSNNLVDNVGIAISGEIDPTQLLISLPLNIATYVGVESIFWPSGGGPSMKSASKAWSTVPADCAGGNTFGFLYKLPDIPIPFPNWPGGLRLLPQP